MGASSKIALGVAGGYLLGRTKKLKLALALGGMLAGKRLAGGQDGLLSHGSELVEKNPELAKLQQDSGNLLGAAKAAALTTATQRLHSLSGTIRGHAEEGEEGEEPDDQDSGEDEEPDTGGPARDDADEPSRRRPSSKTSERTGQSAQKRAQRTAPKSDSKSAGAKKSASGPTKKSASKTASKSAGKSTKKAAKKSAKKSSGANRSSSGR